MYKSAAAPASSSSISKVHVPKPTDELDDLYRQLESIGSQYYCQSFLGTDKFVSECEVGSLPPNLSSLFNEEVLELSYLELLKKMRKLLFYNS